MLCSFSSLFHSLILVSADDEKECSEVRVSLGVSSSSVDDQSDGEGLKTRSTQGRDLAVRSCSSRGQDETDAECSATNSDDEDDGGGGDQPMMLHQQQQQLRDNYHLQMPWHYLTRSRLEPIIPGEPTTTNRNLGIPTALSMRCRQDQLIFIQMLSQSRTYFKEDLQLHKTW